MDYRLHLANQLCHESNPIHNIHSKFQGNDLLLLKKIFRSHHPFAYNIMQKKKTQLKNTSHDRSERATSGQLTCLILLVYRASIYLGTSLCLGVDVDGLEKNNYEKVTSLDSQEELLNISWQLSNIVDRVHKSDLVFSNIDLNCVAVRYTVVSSHFCNSCFVLGVI